jgi:aminoglycoside phosphotransferase (APT) family kinase protein
MPSPDATPTSPAPTAGCDHDRATLAARLRALALPATRDLTPDALAAMPAKGVAHRHYRLAGRGLVLRVPLPAPWGGAAPDAVRYEAACFARAKPSGATPRLVAMVEPGPDLPLGALIVEEIAGRAPRLPADLPAIATALARLHSLPLPPPGERAPLPDHGALGGPVAATVAVIEGQRGYLDSPGAALAPEARRLIEAEMAWARGFAASAAERAQPSLTLVGTDTHPGNFVIRGEDGAAFFVDLEKTLYGGPAIDLAHASLPTSTTWDIEVQATLSPAEVRAFYAAWQDAVPPALADATAPWLRPCRRLTWLRTIVWCVRWRAVSSERAPRAGMDDRLAMHIARRIAAFLEPEALAVLREAALLDPA